MLVCPKSAAHLVKKTEQMRIFTPEQNLDADAYKFDYRIYYDVFVKKSGLDSIWAWIAPKVTITDEPDSITVNEGESNETLSVNANCDGGELGYQWYSCKDENGGGAVKIADATNAQLTLPADLTVGTHYYFAKITVDGIPAKESAVCAVTVEAV